jgi:hypothetical protein
MWKPGQESFRLSVNARCGEEGGMKLYTVTFGEGDAVVIEKGIEVEDHAGELAADLGTDVGGATLAMIPLRIPLVGIDSSGPALEGQHGRRRLLAAGVAFGEEGEMRFLPDDPADDRAFVVLSVIQRSPDARTEVAPLGDGVDCVGNAYERPMDKQVLVMRPGSRVQFRRFGRGGHFGSWRAVTWSGSDLSAEAAHEHAS